MKKIDSNFNKYVQDYNKYLGAVNEGEKFREKIEIKVRNAREELIRQIVEATDATDKKKLARRVALVANKLRWTNTDLHYLLKKHGEVKNFSAFVNWNLKLK